MSQILGVNDPYVIPGTMGGGGSSLPEDSAGYLYNDGSGNLSYDTAPTPEPAGSTTQIQYNKAGVMSASANLTYDESNLTLVDGALRSNVTWDDYTYGSAIKYGTVSQLILSNPTEGYGSVSFYGQWFQVFNSATNEKRSQTVVANYANISLSDGSVDETDYAYGWFRVSGTANVLEGETVTIGSTVYTFRATLASEGDVKISTTLLLSLTNLMYAINGTGTVGVNHQVTAAHADVECTGVYASTVNLKARVAGSAAEAIGLSETSGRLTRSAATMLRESANKYSKVYGFEHAIAVKKGSAQAVKGYTSIVNVGDKTADRTVGSAWGIEQQIAIAALDKTISRGTLKGAYIGCYHNGGLATSQYGVDVDMTVTDDGTGNIAAVTGDVAGLRITMTPGGTPVIGGAVYGIYVSDVSGFTTPSGGAYGLYVAGATANNYIAGNLEVAGTLTARNIMYANVGTAPSAAPVDMAATWCADYAAGDARLYLMGEKNTNTLALGAGNVHFSPTTMADDSVSGETFTGTAGENLVWGDVVYLKSDGKFWKADFNATTTTPAVAFCTGTINADASGEFLRRGWIRDDSAYNFTFGAQAGTIYLGESGAITQTAPSGSGDQVQVLGWALEADIWYFDPQFVIVEV